MDVKQSQEAQHIARASYEAFRDRRRQDAEALLAPDFTFTSPYDDAIDRAAFFARCWPNGDHLRSFEIERMASDGNGVFVTYFITTEAGDSFRNTEYLVIEAGKIKSADVYFGASYREGRFVRKEAPTGNSGSDSSPRQESPARGAHRSASS